MTALLVILTIVLFIAVDYIVHRKEGRSILQSVAGKEEKQLARTVEQTLKESEFSLPSGLFLYPRHTWAHILPSGKIKIGIDDFISKTVGAIDRVILPPNGSKIKVGKPAFSIISGNKKLNFVSPVNGNVLQVNNDLLEDPSLFKDPYRHGWFAVVEPDNIASDIRNLKIADSAKDWLKEELIRFKEFLMKMAGREKFGIQTLTDGGLPARNVLALLDGSEWEKFEKEFLNS